MTDAGLTCQRTSTRVQPQQDAQSWAMQVSGHQSQHTTTGALG